MTDWIEHFHFLRALWLLALPVGVLLCYGLWKQLNTSSSWRRAIEPDLLQHLIHESPGGNRLTPLLLALAGVTLAVIALAGPSWQKLPQPVQKKQDALVILLDLSLSMYAEDIKPSRLDRAKHKLRDILKLRKEGLTALVVFSGDAHIVSPLTDDTKTIAAVVPSLSPAIMPLYGSNALAGIEMANKLISQAGLSGGHILAITDAINSSQHKAIVEQLSNSDLRLSVLAVGTPEGAPITLPNGGFLKDNTGTIVVPKLEIGSLKSLARETGGRFSTLQLSERDVETLLAEFNLPGMEGSLQSVEREFDQWSEEGPWLLLLLVPLASLGFRKGWLLCLPLAFSIVPAPGHAMEWQDLWLNKDQQAARKLSENQPEAAAELFESAPWRGTANYQAGNYQQAAENYATGEQADDHYNRGNALAKGGQLEDALAAYQEALALDPENEDARLNQKLVEDLLKQQQQQEQPQQQQSDQDSQQNAEQQSDQQSEQSSQEQNSEQQNSEQRESEQESERQESDQQNDSQESDKDQNQNQNQDQAQSQNNQEQEKQNQQQQELEQWLRHIPDDPGGLLKRKFEYEYRQNQRQGKQHEQQPW